MPNQSYRLETFKFFKMKLLFKSIFFIFIFTFSLHSCTKDEESINEETKDIHDEKTGETSFSDTTKWELTLVYETLINQEKGHLFNFLNCHGIPDWDNAVFKRGEEVNITNIPTIKNNCISGVFKVYHPIDKTPVINYYSITDINDAIERGEKLSTLEYHAIRGAVQGIILSSQKMGLQIEQVYIDWLREYDNRLSEKVRYYCLETWDCSDGDVSTATNWVDCDGDGYFESCCAEGEFVCCELVSKECWSEDFPVNFPSGDNNTSCGCEEETGGSNLEGTHGDNQTIFDIKSDVLIDWMNENGIDIGYFDLLYDCVFYLPSPFGGEADSGVNENCINNGIVHL